MQLVLGSNPGDPEHAGKNPGSVWLPAVVGVSIAFFAAVGIVPRLARHAELALSRANVESARMVSVASVHLAPRAIEVALPGSTQGIEETTLYARTSGFLRRRFVDIGDRVEAGQLLAEIESPEVDHELERARVHLNEAKANLELAQSTLQRIAALIKTHAVSDQEYDDQKARVNSAEAAVEAGEADVERLATLQSYQKVVAPFAGTISSRSVDRGALITAGSGMNLTSLFTIVDASSLRVFIDVPQTVAPFVKEGEGASITVREVAGRTFAGKVARTAGALDPSTRTLRTEIHLPNPDRALLPGMYVKVRLSVDQPAPAVIIPARTLVVGKEGPQVLPVGSDRTIEYRKVKLGRDFGAELEVVEGLDGTEKLVENPTDDLSQGETVRLPGDAQAPGGLKVAAAENQR